MILLSKRVFPCALPLSFATTPKDHYKTIYFEAFDCIIVYIKVRFDQQDYRRYFSLQNLLLKMFPGAAPPDPHSFPLSVRIGAPPNLKHAPTGLLLSSFSWVMSHKNEGYCVFITFSFHFNKLRREALHPSG